MNTKIQGSNTQYLLETSGVKRGILIIWSGANPVLRGKNRSNGG